MPDKANESSKSPTQIAPPTSAQCTISSPRPASIFCSAPPEPARETLTFGPLSSSISRAKVEDRELLQQTPNFGGSSAASPLAFAEPISTTITAATALPSLTTQDILAFTSVAEAKAVIADFSEGQKDDLIEKLLQLTLEPFRPAPTLASTIAAIQSSQAPNPETTSTTLESSSLYALALDSSVHPASEPHSSALQSTTLHSSALDSSVQQSALHSSAHLSLAPHTSAFDPFALASSSLDPFAIHPSAFEPSALDSPTSFGLSTLQPSGLQHSHLNSSDHHSSVPQSSAFHSSALDSSTLKPLVFHSSALEPPALYLPGFDLYALQPSALQSSGLRSSGYQSSSQSSAFQVSTRKSSEHNPSMSTPGKRRAREARDEELRYRMPMVQQSGRRLQSALEIFDTNPWPTPIVPSQVHKELIESNILYLRRSLRNCELFAVDMARTTENLEFLDHRVLEFYEEIETMAAKQEPFVAEPEEDFSAEYFEDHPYTGLDLDTVDSIMTDTEEETTPKIGGAIEEAASWGATPKALHTESEGSSSVIFAQSVMPDPLSMPGTFTNAICHQEKFLSVPIMALTMMDITPTMRAPTAPRCVLLSHLEVGLDGVEALCQGYVTIDESTYWRENVRERRIGGLGVVKAGTGGYSEALKQEQLKKGMGRGEWLWLGIKFQQSGKERKRGKGGKWACFGVPIEAMKRGVIEEGSATYGGGVDGDGNEVPKHEVKVKRMTYRLSIGGIGCMDLWEGAEQWQNGAWEGIKKAMAHNGLLIRIVVPDDKTMELAQTKARAKNEGRA